MAINTGKAAFPRPYSYDDDRDVVFCGQDGMTLRDYFAAKAMQSMVIIVGGDGWTESSAKTAYEIADAMIEARK